MSLDWVDGTQVIGCDPCWDPASLTLLLVTREKNGRRHALTSTFFELGRWFLVWTSLIGGALRIKILAEIRWLCLFFVFSISDTPILYACLSIGVSEIEKTKKRQSHRISAKVLILIAPPMSDVHTKNQGPSSKNGLVRAYPRPFFSKNPSKCRGVRNRKNEEKTKSSDHRQNFDSQCSTNEWRSHQKSGS